MKHYDIFGIYANDPAAPWNAVDTPEDQICPLCDYDTGENCNCECPHPDCDEAARYCEEHDESAGSCAAMEAYRVWEAMNDPGER